MFDHLQGMRAETLHYLDSLGFLGWQLGMERIEKLCEYLGNPQTRFPVVHIAGTNGKGSTAAMIAAMAQAAGLRVGLYTSPHLVHPRERMRINGVPISGQELEREIQFCRPLVEALRATYFEVLTAISFHWFATQQVDLAVIETGLGGRLDATNVVSPEVTVITSIALEHQEYLGRTLALIAREKAGIIKPGRPCVSGVRPRAARAVIRAECQARGAQLIEVHAQTRRRLLRLTETGTEFRLRVEEFMPGTARDYQLNLLGQHQIDNAVLALYATHLLEQRGFAMNETARAKGLTQVQWPGRLQIVARNPVLLVDAAHNADGMRTLVPNLRRLFPGRRVLVVMSLLKDKALAQVLQAWRELAPEFFFAPIASERALAPERMRIAAEQMGFVAHACPSPRAAVERAKAECSPHDVLCIVGSHYLLGELMQEGLLPYPY